MEAAFWDSLDDICRIEKINAAEFVAGVKSRKPGQNLAAAVRQEITVYIRNIAQRCMMNANAAP
jgi:predicted DNA-binding ribbon-helix-helix protein